MRLIIEESPSQVATWVASYVVKRIAAFAPTPSRPFVLGLPTGSSPLATYKELIKAHKAGEVSFADVITFKCVRGLRGMRGSARAFALTRAPANVERPASLSPPRRSMDEYVGSPRDHPESYHSYMWNNFFKFIDIK